MNSIVALSHIHTRVASRPSPSTLVTAAGAHPVARSWLRPAILLLCLTAAIFLGILPAHAATKSSRRDNTPGGPAYGNRRDAYDVVLLTRDGGARVFQSYPGVKA